MKKILFAVLLILTTPNIVVAQSAKVLDAVGPQSTAVFLVNGTGAATSAFTLANLSKAQITDQLFGSVNQPGNFQDFFKDQSYSKVSFSPTVFDWIDVPLASGTCDLDLLMDNAALRSIVMTQAIDLRNYKRLVFLVNNNNKYGGCSIIGTYTFRTFLSDGSYADISVHVSTITIGGYTSLNDSNPVTRGTGATFALAHEMGHSLGLQHANAWLCDNTVISGSSCGHAEYYNKFDVMGFGKSADNLFGISAYYRWALGWIADSDVVNINTPGTYSLSPLEGSAGKRLAVIQNPRTTPSSPEQAGDRYFLEQRRATGFDAGLATLPWYSSIDGFGLFVGTLNTPRWSTDRMIPGYPTVKWFGTSLDLLDMNPGVLPTGPSDTAIDDAPLVQGASFSDTNSGTSVTAVASNAATQAVNFTVGFTTPACVLSNPTLNSGTTFYGVPGSPTNVSVVVTNQNIQSCGSSIFSVAAGLPSTAFSESVVSSCPNTAMITPGGTSTFCRSITNPGNPGTYPINYTVTDTTNTPPPTTTGAYSLVVKAPVIISGVTPTAPYIAINGSGFSLADVIVFHDAALSVYQTFNVNSSIFTSSNVLNFQIPTNTPAGSYTLTVTDSQTFSSSSATVVVTVSALGATSVAVGQDLSGYAWSDTVGWISFSGAMTSGVKYSTKIDPATGAFSGDAWSSGLDVSVTPNQGGVGWISFNRSETGNPPGPPDTGVGPIAKVDTATGNVTGWARALSACNNNLVDALGNCTGSGAGDTAGGWDGWIKLSDSTWTNGVKIDPATGNLSGYAWGGAETTASGASVIGGVSVVGGVSFSGTASDGSAYGVTGPVLTKPFVLCDPVNGPWGSCATTATCTKPPDTNTVFGTQYCIDGTGVPIYNSCSVTISCSPVVPVPPVTPPVVKPIKFRYQQF